RQVEAPPHELFVVNVHPDLPEQTAIGQAQFYPRERPGRQEAVPPLFGLRLLPLADQEIGLRTNRPYAMNAMTRPSTMHITMVGISRYLACTPMNTRLSNARIVAATTVRAGCQWRAAGTISPTTQTSSMMPRAIQTRRGNAPK